MILDEGIEKVSEVSENYIKKWVMTGLEV